MKHLRKMNALVMGASALALAGGLTVPAMAQSGASSVGEVVVTARRTNESIQHVPETITAVTGKQVQDLKLFSTQDISAVVPGLTLDAGAEKATGTAIQMRGITWTQDSGANPTVPIYIDEIPTDASYAFQSMYDVGQIEVLRGPQGTLRGQPSPSGAVTVTTTPANTSRYGGYLSFTASDRNLVRGEGALNIPIIKDVLGLRLVGLIDQNDAGGVHSVNNTLKPYKNTGSWRASLRYQPTDNLDINLSYENLQTQTRYYQQVEGAGQTLGLKGGGFVQVEPANYSGPAISPTARLAVESDPIRLSQYLRVFTATGQLDLGAHRLSLLGSSQLLGFHNTSVNDPGNFMGGFDHAPGNISTSAQENYFAEGRFETVAAKFWDYGVGYWFSDFRSQNIIESVAAYLPGSFGSPLGLPRLSSFNPNYAYDSLSSVPNHQNTNAVFANSTFHLTHTTDLFLGARYQVVQTQDVLNVHVTNGVEALSSGAHTCAQIGAAPSANYPGLCDLNLPSFQPFPTNTSNRTSRPWVYNASLTQRFTDTINAYVSYGHSWRLGPPNYNILNISGTDPAALSLLLTKPETSDSYEVGLKTQWFDRRFDGQRRRVRSGVQQHDLCDPDHSLLQ